MRRCLEDATANGRRAAQLSRSYRNQVQSRNVPSNPTQEAAVGVERQAEQLRVAACRNDLACRTPYTATLLPQQCQLCIIIVIISTAILSRQQHLPQAAGCLRQKAAASFYPSTGSLASSSIRRGVWPDGLFHPPRRREHHPALLSSKHTGHRPILHPSKHGSLAPSSIQAHEPCSAVHPSNGNLNSRPITMKGIWYLEQQKEPYMFVVYILVQEQAAKHPGAIGTGHKAASGPANQVVAPPMHPWAPPPPQQRARPGRAGVHGAAQPWQLRQLQAGTQALHSQEKISKEEQDQRQQGGVGGGNHQTGTYWMRPMM